MPDIGSAVSPLAPAVLQADRITQSASSLRAAISEAVRNPSSRSSTAASLVPFAGGVRISPGSALPCT